MAAEEYTYTLKIPKERIAVLIGTKGKIKLDLEKSTNTKIDVDSAEGEVTVSGQDGIALFVAREIIRAIGRGFSPEIAFLLQKQDYGLEIIPLEAKKAYFRNTIPIIEEQIYDLENQLTNMTSELESLDETEPPRQTHISEILSEEIRKYLSIESEISKSFKKYLEKALNFNIP